MRDWFYEQMAMYTAYHKDWRNKLSHQIGVPMIVFSLFILASTVQLGQTSVGPITLAAVFMAMLALFYIMIAPLIGTLSALIYGLLLFYAEQIGRLDMPLVWQAFAVFFIGGWAFQLVGHFYEGRKPALLDNAMQILVAPAFLIAEVLFILKLEQGLQSQIESRLHKYERQD